LVTTPVLVGVRWHAGLLLGEFVPRLLPGRRGPEAVLSRPCLCEAWEPRSRHTGSPCQARRPGRTWRPGPRCPRRRPAGRRGGRVGLVWLLIGYACLRYRRGSSVPGWVGGGACRRRIWRRLRAWDPLTGSTGGVSQGAVRKGRPPSAPRGFLAFPGLEGQPRRPTGGYQAAGSLVRQPHFET